MNTPAVTMVAAWMRAETGVGPSMASGSQVCSRNCADLPMAPMKSSRQAMVRACHSMPRNMKRAFCELCDAREDLVEGDAVEQHEDREDAEQEAEIADAVDDEGLHGRRVGGILLVPEADEQIAREAHAFPAEEHLDEVVRRHQHEHGEGEERQIGEEARTVRILVHVADGIEVHEGRNGIDHHQHHDGQRVDPERPIDLEIADRHPLGHLDTFKHRLGARLSIGEEPDLNESHPGQDRRHEEQRGRDDLARPGAEDPSEDACDEEADERQEDDCVIHCRLLRRSGLAHGRMILVRKPVPTFR